MSNFLDEIQQENSEEMGAAAKAVEEQALRQVNEPIDVEPSSIAGPSLITVPSSAKRVSFAVDNQNQKKKLRLAANTKSTESIQA